jgi:choline dehydrogenase
MDQASQEKISQLIHHQHKHLETMSSNHNRLCRDGIYGSLQIKSKRVLDKDSNLSVADAKVRGNAKVKEDLTVCGDLIVQGCVSQLGGEYDIIICGCGTAGAVIAEQLSRSQYGLSVLVLEQGANENANPKSLYPFNADTDDGMGLNLIDNIFDVIMSDNFPTCDANGNVAAEVMVKAGGHGGRGWGGASNHNFMVSFHTTDDFDNIIAANYGDDNWNAGNTRPLKMEIENAIDPYDNSTLPGRGVGGPLTISQAGWFAPPPPVTPGSNLVGNLLACIDTVVTGLGGDAGAIGDDYNAAGEELGRYVRQQYHATRNDPTFLTRESAATAYLNDTVVDQVTGLGKAGHDGLEILSNVFVNRVQIVDQKACGVEVLVGGKTKYFSATKKVIVCAGGVRSPGILERSGVGDPTVLADAGVDLVYANPAVGNHMLNHGISQLFAQADTAAITDAQAAGWATTTPHFLTLDGGAQPYGTMRRLQGFISANALFPVYQPDTVALKQTGVLDALTAGNELFIQAINLQPTSEGSAHIVNNDPTSIPRVLRAMYTSDEDKSYDIEMYQFWKAVEDCMGSNYPTDSFEFLYPPSTAFANTDDLVCYIKGGHIVQDHWSSTCRMGQIETGNVVGPDLHVYGIENLMVADSSIWPIMPGGNTALPAFLVGKQAAKFCVNELFP